MYTLVNGLYKHLTRKEEYAVIILGLDNAGKTTILEQVKCMYNGKEMLPPEKIMPTVGLNIGKIDIGYDRLNFWDLGGQKELHSIWEKYYAECHAIVFVVDATDRDRIEECKNTFDSVVGNEQAEGVPVLMVANKQDQISSLKVEEVKELFNPIAQKLGARDSTVLAISALKGDGVKDMVQWLHLRITRNKVNKPPTLK